MLNVVFGLLAFAALGFGVGRIVYALFTEGRSDRADIRAAYEGLVGLAGPNAKVVSIDRAGISLSDRTLRRRYDVVVQRHNGTRLSTAVGVPVGPLNSGEVVELA